MTGRVERWLSVLGNVAIVAAIGQFHASVRAVPRYTFLAPTARIVWTLAFLALLLLATYAVGLPDRARSTMHAAGLAATAAGVAAAGISLAQLATGNALLPRFVVFASMLAVVPWQVLVYRFDRRERARDGERDRILLVATLAERERLIDDLAAGAERTASLGASLEIADAAAVSPATSPLVDAARDAAATVVVLDRTAQVDDRVIDQAAVLHESGVRVRTLQAFYEEWLGKLPLSELERESLFFDIGEVHRALYTRVKRIVDVVIGMAGVVVLLVMTPLVVVGNLIANRGPLLFRQTRVGKNGTTFEILKFRTMRPDDEPNGPGRWTTADDPRVTPWGRVLRRTHLDELPQMINIIRGDLAVVGPRPEQPHYVEELRGKLAFYELRHLVRPGLTGWAQVKYGYAGDERDALEKLQYEFFYLRHQNLAFDARIILRTVRSVVGGSGRGR